MKNHTVILIHGFNVRYGGKKSTDNFTFPLEQEGYEVIELDYPRTGLVSTRFVNNTLKKTLKRLIRHIKQDGRKVTVIGHSNGCTIAYLASLNAFPSESPDNIICFNPAILADAEFGREVKNIYIFYSQSDMVLFFGKWLKLFTPTKWFGDRPWGAMGRSGYIGDDRRVHNVDLELLIGNGKVGHSTVFQNKGLFKKALELVKRFLNET